MINSPNTPPSAGPSVNPKSSHEEGKRGILLSTILLFKFIGAFGSVAIIAFYPQAKSLPNSPFVGNPIFAAAISCISLVVLIAVWRWKRWGVYALAGLVFAGLIAGAVTNQPPALLSGSLVIHLVMLLAISRRWRFFK